jgi:nitrogen fixation protein FixH
MDKSLRYLFYGIIFSFLCLFAATYHTVKIALAGHEPVINPNYYEVGLNYEKHLNEQKKMAEDGYLFTSPLLEKNYLVTGPNQIQVKFLKKDEVLTNSEVKVKIERKATMKFNKTIDLKVQGDGTYLGEIDVEGKGQWVMTFSGTHEGKTYLYSFPVDILN